MVDRMLFCQGFEEHTLVMFNSAQHCTFMTTSLVKLFHIFNSKHNPCI